MLVGTLIYKVKGHFTYELKEIMFCGVYCMKDYAQYVMGFVTYWKNHHLHVYFHLVMASKILMPPMTHLLRCSLCTYKFCNEILMIIHEGINS